MMFVVPHLPVLQVVIPLFFAPLCILLRRRAIVWWTAMVVCWVCFIISIALVFEVLTADPISYAMGGWAAPWGIEYRVDIANAPIVLIVTGITAVVTTFALFSILKEVAEERVYLFYALWLLHLAGLCGVVVTNDAFNLFVFIEIASLSSYAMIGAGRGRRALIASYRYLMIGTVGATFILIGVGLLYAMTGTLNIADLAARLRDVEGGMEGSETIATAFAFLTVGLCIKCGIFPLHYWLPNAYTHAPSVVSALLAGTTSKVFIYVLLRFLFTLFGTDYAFDLMLLDRILMIMALLAIVSGSLLAIYASDVKQLLAYSSVAQIGYMVLGISLLSMTGLSASLVHVLNHALIKTALFIAVACYFFRIGSNRLDDLRGIGRRMPLTTAALLVGGLSLIGVPATAGFISKWYLVSAALAYNLWLAVLILASSLLAVIYVGKILEAVFSRVDDRQAPVSAVREAPLPMLCPLLLIALANVYFGFDTRWTAGLAEQAAAHLIGAH